MEVQIKKYDKLLLGLALGIITPVLVLLVYYQVNFYYIRVDTFLYETFMKRIFLPLLSLCVVGNLAVFFLFIQTDRYLSARGVVLATLIYAILVFILKFTL
ncbi:MAG: hypothetical protein IPO70_04265 [Bacteroidetes bacterium]|nr:hypothetical protein [Bacteroidota bacterium]MBK9671464.1 hypothetical protein [Bacteroidota bacterium]MBP6413603.1 hypothetical protein [Bacteroidia bacterium]HRH01507.1 hypothetical protein [Bacteroidia bacterium]HRH07386.1 hypothetical protein [Bacteroidia bacterium]